MKRIIKCSILALAVALLAAVFALGVFAAESDGILYEVYDEGGYIIKYGIAPEDFITDIGELEGAFTFKLTDDVNLGGGVISLVGTETLPRTVNIDLAGKNLIFEEKTDSIRIHTYSFATLNIYSSVPGANLHCSDYNEDTSTYRGDPLFSVSGKDVQSSVINCGKFTDKNGVTYSGDNLTVSTIALASSGEADNTCIINFDGGTYIRVPTADHRAFIMSTGDATLNITDANILTHGNVFRLEGKSGVCTVEDSVISGYNNNTPSLVLNYAMPTGRPNYFYGKLVLKNSVIIAKLTEVSIEYDTDLMTELHRGQLMIEENCVFSKSGVVEAAVELATKKEGDVAARVNPNYNLRGGRGEKINHILYNGEMGGYETVQISRATLAEAIGFTTEANSFTCYFQSANGIRDTDVWMKGVKPITSLNLPDTREEGLYKADWFFGTDSFGASCYTVGLTVDFGILYSFTSSLECNVYFPAHFMDDGYMDMVNSTFGGRICKSDEYVKVKLGEEEYYRVIIAPDTSVGEIEVVLAGKKTKNEFKGTFKINLADYLETITKENKDNEKLCRAALDLAYFASLSYAKWNPEYTNSKIYNRLSDMTAGASLTASDSETMAPYLGAKVEDGALADNFAAAEVECIPGLPLKFNIPEGFTGKVKIYVGECVDVYEVKDGKFDKESFIRLRLPSIFAAEKITVKAYRDGSSLLSSDGEKTGEYSFINGYSSAPAEDRELYAAYVAFGISLKAYLADGK